MYRLGDFIIRLKNASLARRRIVVFPYSKINKAISDILVKEGFLKSIAEETEGGKKTLVGQIQYQHRKPVFVDVALVSKPSLRIYTKGNSVATRKRKGFRIEIISTSQGVMTSRAAQKIGIGGELLFQIW